MDFTQIMQRYVRLREKYEQGELDARSFENQVNSMVFKDEQDRYWQIGVESGKWYYYDGEHWVQDDLIQDDEESIEKTTAPTETEIDQDEEFNQRINAFLAADEDESPAEEDEAEAEPDAEETDEDEEVLYGFDEEKDPLDALLEEDERWMAPAEEVDSLSDHLMETQPVSIESLMGEDKEYIEPTSDDDLEFLLGDAAVDKAEPGSETGSNYLADIAAYLAETQAVDAEEDEELFESGGSDETGIQPESISSAPIESLLEMPEEEEEAETVNFEVLPVEIDEETLEAAEAPAEKPKKKRKKSFIFLIAALAVLVICAAAFLTVYFLKQPAGLFAPAAEETIEQPKELDMSVLDYDDFAKNDSGWPILEGDTGYTGYFESDFYYIYPLDPDRPTIAVKNYDLDDGKIIVDTAQIIAETPILTTYGVMCRVQENGDGYAFRITSDGQYVIERYENGVFQPINGWKFSEIVMANNEVNENHFEITCMGNQLIFGMNGQILDIAIDETFKSGDVAFTAQRGGWDASTEIHFDEYYLRRP
ncbi:MAG: hypothetical protein JW750_04575 [Anaerolineaceae bacterium]|nr:hypothetical protein [Anaerolineaceae bacterium]